MKKSEKCTDDVVLIMKNSNLIAKRYNGRAEERDQGNGTRNKSLKNKNYDKH